MRLNWFLLNQRWLLIFIVELHRVMFPIEQNPLLKKKIKIRHPFKMRRLIIIQMRIMPKCYLIRKKKRMLKSNIKLCNKSYKHIRIVLNWNHKNVIKVNQNPWFNLAQHNVQLIFYKIVSNLKKNLKIIYRREEIKCLK
jgi:hypothetical protein